MIYTLRKAGDPDKPTYELSKWDGEHIHPIDIYTQWIVKRGEGNRAVYSCNCPSRSNPCKHAEMSIALLTQVDGNDDQLPFFYWENGVKEVDDL